MTPGLAINYFKWLHKHIDFAGSLEGSFLQYPMTSRSFGSDHFLLAANATFNFKMTSEKYIVQPYLIAGVGGQQYDGYWGATIPLGVGLKVNLMDETHIFVTSQYRVPVTKDVASYHFNNAIGIAAALTKKKEKVIPPPPPPPPPADTDGDGN